MKGFMKGCAITALIFFLLGIGLVTTAFMLGDKDKMAASVWEVTDGRVEFVLNSWQDFGIHFYGFDILAPNASDMFDSDYEIWDEDVEKTQISKNPIDEMDIRVNCSSLVIKESEDEFFYIEKNGGGKLQAYEEKGILHIRALLNTQLFGYQQEEEVILYVPASTNLKVVTVELGAGEMVWNELQADVVSVELGAGEFVAKNTVVGDLKVDLGAGECLIQGKLQGNVKVDCAAGEVTLIHSGAEEEFDYDIDCSVGSVQVGKEKYSGLATAKKVDNDASKTMEISVAAGSVEVEFE